MKTIFMVSRKPDFSACRLMTESALMSHGYICCGTYKVYDVTGSASTFVGEMNAAAVIKHIEKEAASFRDEEMSLKAQIESLKAELSEEMKITSGAS